MEIQKLSGAVILLILSIQSANAKEWVEFNYLNQGGQSWVEITYDNQLQVVDLVTLVDEVDVTELLQRDNNQLFLPLSKSLKRGKHSIHVFMTTIQGWKIQQHFDFKHTTPVQITSLNRVDADVAQLLYDDTDTSSQHYSVDTQWVTNNRIRSDNSDYSGDAEFWYFDTEDNRLLENSNSLLVPNYQLRSRTRLENSDINATIGNVNLYFSDLSLQYVNRRGAKLDWITQQWQNSIFTVKTTERIDFSGGTGISGDTDDSMHGINSIYKINDSSHLGIIAVNAGIEGQSDGQFVKTSNPQTGQLLGVKFETALLGNRLKMSSEYNRTRFDENRNDSESADNDAAWRLSIEGSDAYYKYGISYERVGKDYNVITNPTLINDRKTASIFIDLTGKDHRLRFDIAGEEKNINHDKTKADITTVNGQIDYRYNFTPGFYVGLNFQEIDEVTENEPDAVSAIDGITRTVRSYTNWRSGNWNIQLNLSGSRHTDDANTARDSQLTNFSFYPFWRSGSSHLYPGVSWIETRFSDDSRQTQLLYSVNGHHAFLYNRLMLDGAILWNGIDTQQVNTRTYSCELQMQYAVLLPHIDSYGVNVGVLLQSRSPSTLSDSQHNDGLIWFTLKFMASN